MLVCDTKEHFSMNLMNQKHLTLLACGRNYANLKESWCRTFSCRSLSTWRWWSNHATTHRGFTQRMSQQIYAFLPTSFHARWYCSDFDHMILRILSFQTGVIVGWSNSRGAPLSERLAELIKKRHSKFIRWKWQAIDWTDVTIHKNNCKSLLSTRFHTGGCTTSPNTELWDDTVLFNINGNGHV